MGKLEKQVRERMRNTRLQRVILSVVGSVAELTTQMLAGSVYKMYNLMDRAERKKKYASILASRKRLVTHGLLRWNGRFLELTAEGRKKLCEWGKCDYQLSRPEKWDGRWRILIFDIPEKRRWIRDRIRDTLRAVGFKRLQKSVWVYPFDCEDFITLLKADFKIGKDLLYLIVEGLENDAPLRDYFGVYPS